MSNCWIVTVGSGDGWNCPSYPLTECPTNAICQSCAEDTGKKKFIVCDYGYYNAGSSTAPNCISCTSAKATISQDKMADFNEQCQGY